MDPNDWIHERRFLVACGFKCAFRPVTFRFPMQRQKGGTMGDTTRDDKNENILYAVLRVLKIFPQ